MLTIMNIGELIDRKGDTLTSLMTSALIIILPSPETILSASFMLSFSAVAGLSLLQKPIYEFLGSGSSGKLSNYICDSISSAAAAQLATAPVCAVLFKSVPLLGVFANLSSVWLIQPIMALGILSVAAASVSPVLAMPFVFVCKRLVTLLIFIARAFASIPFMSINFSEYWQFIWLFGSLLLAVILICRAPFKHAGYAAAIGISIVYIIASLFSFALGINSADIVVFDDADCAAVIKSGHAVLIGTPQNRWHQLDIENTFSALGVEKLDNIIISDSKDAVYCTYDLAHNYRCRYLCSPNDHTANAFCQSASMELCKLPQDSPLFGKMRLTVDENTCEIQFNGGKLLKNEANYDIIGKYQFPMQLEGVRRFRVTM